MCQNNTSYIEYSIFYVCHQFSMTISMTINMTINMTMYLKYFICVVKGMKFFIRCLL